MSKQALYGWTNYPIPSLDDEGKSRPFYAVKVIAYDRDKYATVQVGGVTFDMKSGYIMRFNPGRWRAKRKCAAGVRYYCDRGNIPFSYAQLCELPEKRHD